MIESFKETWNKIQQDPPGKRFRRQYRRRQAAREGIVNRVLFVGVGMILFVVGIIMLFTPGPGIFFIFLGWGLIAQESLWLAILLDKLEIYLRKWIEWGEATWKKASLGLKFLIIAGIVLISLVAFYLVYHIIWA